MTDLGLRAPFVRQSGTKRTRLAVVTSTMPFGTREAFLVPELKTLAALVEQLVIIPMRPGRAIVHEDARTLEPYTRREPLLSWSILRAAVGQALRRPVRSLRCLGLLLGDLRPRILTKNLAVYAKALWLAQMLHDERIEHVHAHWAATTATLAMVSAMVADVPWSFTAHRWDIAERNLLRTKLRRAAFVRAISQEGALELCGDRPPSSRSALVIHMGVNVPTLAPRLHAQNRPACKILVPANLVEVKGHRYVLEALRHLADQHVEVEVDIAGAGPLRGVLEDLAASLGVAHAVRFRGAIPHERLLDGLASNEWDLVVLPSIVTGDGEREGIPVSLMEAMAHGVPVIATATGGIPELIVDGTGLLVPPENAARLAHAIAALATDSAARARYGHAGRQRVREAFTVEGAVEALLRRVTASGNGAP